MKKEIKRIRKLWIQVIIITILFVLILGIVAFSLVHYGRNVDYRIQKYLEKLFLNRIPFKKCSYRKIITLS
jgi:hypothetical protein